MGSNLNEKRPKYQQKFMKREVALTQFVKVCLKFACCRCELDTIGFLDYKSANNKMWDFVRWFRSPQNRLWWRVTIGPTFLILALLICGLRTGWPTPWLALTLSLSVPLCGRFGIRGCGVCLAMTLLAMAWELQHLGVSDRIWHLGLGGALNCALLLVALGKEEMEHAWQALSACSKHEAEVLHTLHQELAQKREQISSLLGVSAQLQGCENQIVDLRGRLTEQSQALDQQLQQEREAGRKTQEGLLVASQKVQTLEGYVVVLREELASEKEQNAQLDQQVGVLQQQLQEQEVQRTAMIEEKQQLQEHLHLHMQAAEKRVQQAVDRYKQLRGQFEQKGEVLHQARETIWQVETRLEGLLRERAEERLLGVSKDSEFLLAAGELEGQLQRHEQEICRLEELVSELLIELKRRSVPGLSGLRIPGR